jgi:hypothetical protein
MALWALGNVHSDQGKLSSAFVLHTQSMELLEEILGPTHHKTAACYYKIAWFLHKQGQLKRSMCVRLL